MRIDHRHIALLVCGNFLLAIASSWFILPAHIISGGINGIAVILEKVLGLDPMLVINIMIVSCFLLGLCCLGKSFALKTIASAILYPCFLQIASLISLPIFPTIIASLIGGILTGLGIGLVMRSGGSSGGMDVPPLILHKYFHLPVSFLVLLCDSLIVFAGLVVYGWMPVLIGLLSVFVCSKALGVTLEKQS